MQKRISESHARTVPMNKECNFDWLSNMAPLLKDSMVKIRMVLPVQC